MLEALKDLDYKKVLYYFSELAAIPHGSGNTGELADYLERFAKERKIRYVRDAADNIIFYKAATAGYEERPAVILQGHMDMVCEKEADSEHDFTKDGLSLQFDGEWLSADKTTLGGDDGIAVAYCLALLDDAEAKHPALELIVTTEEEIGMDGAKALDASALSGKYMINMDSEEEDVVLCGCAGGMRVHGELPLKRIPMEGTRIRVCVRGLQGGHSGVEIDKNRTNAIVWLARYLFTLREQVGFAVEEFYGGQKDNAIPREADAVLLVDTDAAEEVLVLAKQLAEQLAEEIRGAEPRAEISVTVGRPAEDGAVIHPLDFEKLLFLLMQCPNGVQTMSADIPGLVESSLNLGVFRIEPQAAVCLWSLRSSKKSYLGFLKEKLCYLIGFLGGDYETSGEYPAWEYRPESGLRKVYADNYQEIFGKQPAFSTIHAGLECGILSEKLPGLDIISIGPEIRDIHTPAERLHVGSALRMYRLLEKILADDRIS